jgi:hypothetical protein
MKNTIKFSGLLALVAVIAMTVVGCDLFGNKDDDSEDDTPPPVVFPTNVPSSSGTCSQNCGFNNASSITVYVKIGDVVKSVGANKTVYFDNTATTYQYAPSDKVSLGSNSYTDPRVIKFVALNANGTITVTNSNLTSTNTGQSINGGTANITKVVITDAVDSTVVVSETVSVAVYQTSKTFSVPGNRKYQVEITKNGATYKITTGIQQQSLGANLGYLPMPYGGKASLRFAVNGSGACLGWRVE